MGFGIAVIGRLLNFNRLDIQQYEQDTDITAGWETDMFLDTAPPDAAVPVSSSQIWEDWNYDMSRLVIDPRYRVAATSTSIWCQQEHEPSNCVQHEDERRKDLRSASIQYKRDAERGQKYYHFKAVKLGDVGQAYYTAPDDTTRPFAMGLQVLPADLSKAKIEVWTKRSLFTEAQRYPGRPQHHHYCRGCKGTDAWTKRQARARDISQTLKVSSSARLCEEDRLVDLDVATERLGDNWIFPNEAHAHSYTEVNQVKNNQIVGEILDRAMVKWEERQRCGSSSAALSGAPPELS